MGRAIALSHTIVLITIQPLISLCLVGDDWEEIDRRTASADAAQGGRVDGTLYRNQVRDKVSPAVGGSAGVVWETPVLAMRAMRIMTLFHRGDGKHTLGALLW